MATTRKNLELLYGMLQKQKQLKKHVDYEQLINVLAMDKSMLEEELRAIKSKLKLYDRLFFIMLGSFSVVYVGFGMLIAKQMQPARQMLAAKASANACCKCLLQMQPANAMAKMLAAKQMQPANACSINACSKANATCKENACCKGKLQILASKQMQPTRQTLAAMQMLAAKASRKCLQQSKCNLQGNCLLQRQAANACSKANATCKANACSKSNAPARQMLAAKASCMLASKY
ncbi:hypothetical protein Tco_0269495 [Tanacetum coccineum]